MEYVLGAIAGLLYGSCFILLKQVFRRLPPVKKQDANKQLLLYIPASMLLNVAAMISVYFLRHLLPWSFPAMLIAVAVTLSLGGKLVALGEQKSTKRQTEAE